MKSLILISTLSIVLALSEARIAYGEEDKKVDVCKLPIEEGPCKAFFPRFGFDVETNRCKNFVYGGGYSLS